MGRPRIWGPWRIQSEPTGEGLNPNTRTIDSETRPEKDKHPRERKENERQTKGLAAEHTARDGVVWGNELACKQSLGTRDNKMIEKQLNSSELHVGQYPNQDAGSPGTAVVKLLFEGGNNPVLSA